MKNRPITIALIVAVVFIWAWIMYSVFDYMESPEVAVLSNNKPYAVIKQQDSVITDYVLALNYKDPFLKKAYSVLNNTNQSAINGVSSTIQNAKVNNKTKTPDVPEIPLPVIHYAGRIVNAKLNKPIAILVIDNHEYMMQEGEIKEGVTLSQIKTDSVKVMCFKKIFYVKKQ